MRELIVATIGAVMLIALGLATMNATESHTAWDDASYSGASDGPSASMSLRLAD